MEAKKVTLNNGTVLEDGKTYYVKNHWNSNVLTITAIGVKNVLHTNSAGVETQSSIELDWLPYTPPTPKKEWKTFLIEFSGIKYRAILQYETLEQAQFHHPNAISITEVKINIEPVNN